MKFLWGAKRLGVLSSRGFLVDNGRTYLREDEIKTFTFYGVVVGMRFFGFQKAKFTSRNVDSNVWPEGEE